jgi:hypothetical protein
MGVDEKVAQIPTVMQAGYAAGLLFLCPLGDLLPRRPFVVGLVGFTTMMWWVKFSVINCSISHIYVLLRVFCEVMVGVRQLLNSCSISSSSMYISSSCRVLVTLGASSRSRKDSGFLLL